MVRFDVRPVLRAIDIMLSFVVVLCTLRAAAQSPADAGGISLVKIADAVVAAQAEGGPYAKDLIEPLTQLSVLYHESGDYALESAALEQALQVVRANYGLYSLEQAALIRQRARSAESIADYAQAWELEQALLALAHRHPDDLRTVPIFHEVGDERMELMRSHLDGLRPPQLYLGCYYEGSARFSADLRNCNAGSRAGAAHRILMDAQRNYAAAIGVLRRHQQYGGELEELESKLLRNSHLYGGYQQGRQSLVRLIYDDAANAQPLLRRIDRLVQLADWDLTYGQRTLALDLYAEIYGFLQKEAAEQTSIDAIFSPATPIVLPTFVPNLFAPARADGATGYVDVEFDITQFGSTRRIKTLGATDAVSKAAEQRISRWIVENRFRPRMANGRLDEASRVVARHYVHE